jgi:hypothetical protein
VKPLNLFLAMLLTLAMSAAVCARAPEQVPAIGAKLNKHWLTAGEHELCMTSPAQLDPCFEQAFEGVRYRVAYSSKSKRVTYLTTSDGKFRTHSGLRVGDEIAISENTVRAWPGWEVHAPTTSDGWRPIVGFNSEVKLKDGTVLNLREKQGVNITGTATIGAFSKGRN